MGLYAHIGLEKAKKIRFTLQVYILFLHILLKAVSCKHTVVYKDIIISEVASMYFHIPKLFWHNPVHYVN